MKTKNLFSLLSAVFCLFFLLTACSSDCTCFENGSFRTAGPVSLVELRGTWHEMGRQYGRLMKSHLSNVAGFVREYMQTGPYEEERALAAARKQEQTFSFQLKEFFRGAAETSDLSMEDLLLANAVERIITLPGCSAVFAWGPYTDGTMIAGRNYDYSKGFRKLWKDLALTVYHPADGSLAAATFGYAGEIYTVNGFNEKGLFLELNTGAGSVRTSVSEPVITGTSLLFELMFRADTLDYAEHFFNTGRCSSAYIINMTDGSSAVSYEWCSMGVKKGPLADEGLLVSANAYRSPEWKLPAVSDAQSMFSFSRYSNLLKLSKAEKGHIDENTMKKIISTDYFKGGAENEFTVFQMVVLPGKNLFHVNILGEEKETGWISIDLAPFFN